ncbi:hypothetical protein A7C99_5905 [Trichophyton rubrum]|uniref:Orc1-like AAA ATPase domain-containing protein n=1 Tax=Trichophyton rubrum TaxID=5551 RepID=A0A178EUC1_TRIRU|nr:hypothetical protein A7C99_5905 [Trichophyton rubrum]
MRFIRTYNAAAGLGLRGAVRPRYATLSQLRRHYGSQDVAPGGPPQPGKEGPDPDESSREKSSNQQDNSLKATLLRMFESSATTFASIAVLGYVIPGVWLNKMDNAFEPGDPMLELAGVKDPKQDPKGSKDMEKDPDHWLERDEQGRIDEIINGAIGHYYLLIGEKGTGKTSMILNAMRKVDGSRVAMFEAHANLEIFRIRLGKSLDYEFHEDYIGSLFSIRGPRDTTALLDIERALNKLEKVAIKRRNVNQNPLILIINSLHLVRDDDDGRDLLEMLQQRAEQWAASGLVTMVFNSDDYWIYERLKRYASRMEVIPIPDLPKGKALGALRRYRSRYFKENPPQSILEEVYNKVGGRLTFLNRVAKSEDMIATCNEICEAEKTWFLNKCWILGEEMDDDVMDEQKYSSAAMVLAKALVDLEKDMEKTYDDENGHILPELPLHKARQIMTRADFIQSYDHDNIFTIDSKARVRADSVPMQNAFREICSEPGFDQYLEDTLDRISAIESLGRTREITVKDFWNEGKFKATMRDTKGRETGTLEIGVVKPEKQEDDD